MTMEKRPEIAILRWEQGDVPAGLKQLGDITGNSSMMGHVAISLGIVKLY